MFSQPSIVPDILLGALFMAAPAGIGWCHAYPEVSVPRDGSTLAGSPREVRIHFTEGVEVEFSRITVKGANGEVVSQGRLRRLADDTIAIDLNPLRPGNYAVEWQVLSVDTHITDGLLRFTVTSGNK
jgi:copper resistance protein C